MATHHGGRSGSKNLIIRERYEATCSSYDEVYRAEQFEKYFTALKRVPPRGKVLDAGCGTGLLVEFMALNGLLAHIEKLVCLDYSRCMSTTAQWRLRVLCPTKCSVIVGSVDSLPSKHGYFDVVYSFTVLDLVDKPLHALRELLLASRGPVVVSLMKRLHTKDLMLNLGELIGVTSKDVVIKFEPTEALKRLDSLLLNY